MPRNGKLMRIPNYYNHLDTASRNNKKFVCEKQNSLFCRTHKPWIPKRDAVHGLYMIFEMLQVFENKPLRLARWVITLYPGLRIFSFEVSPFNVIHHLRRAAKRTHPLLIALQFVTNAKGALCLSKDKRKELGIGRFLLDERSGWEGDPESVSSRHFAAAAEREHETGGVDPSLDNILRGDTRNMSADEFGQLRPFEDLMLNHRLDILLFLLSLVLPLNVFCRATAEVVGSVFFRDDIPPPGPGNTDLRGKTSNFRLDLRPLDPVSSRFQLLPPLLEVDDGGIGGKRCKNVVRHVNWRARITHEAHVSKHAEDAICRRPLENSRQDIKSHPLIDVSPIIHRRVRVVSHNLISNRIRGSTVNDISRPTTKAIAGQLL